MGQLSLDKIFLLAAYIEENLGSAAAIYRCWVLWNKDWRVTALPIALLLMNTVVGYYICSTYASIDPTATVFNYRLDRGIKTFYSTAVVLNVTTTGLLSWRIYMTHRSSSVFNAVKKGYLLSVLQILLESAALQFIVEAVLLILYCSIMSAQYMVLESVVSIVGITYMAIALRLRLHMVSESNSQMSTSRGTSQVQTIGSVPMQRIHINIKQDVEKQDAEDIASVDAVYKQ
ncbi:hypothetical protein H0H92_004129 [Tricholoma furcatifolium]|nr:hypothetical protein H0H92_004129 [Tricholoma furcatifolium]